MDDLKERLMRIFDREVRELGQDAYRDLLEEMIGDLEARLDCVKEEMAADGVD